MAVNMTAQTIAVKQNWVKSGDSYVGDQPDGTPALTATAISQDQIDLSWPAQAGKGIAIERATSSGGPYSVVAFYDEGVTSIKLYSHQPNTTYYFRARYFTPSTTSSYSSVVNATTSAAVNTYYVATTGNDTTGDGSSGNPYASIQKAVHVATAGDVINVNAGTFNEVAEWPAADGGGTPTFSGNRPAGIALVNSGTATAPIIIQANPGDTVTIDQQGTHMGFAFWDSVNAWPDYIHIKDFNITNCLFSAIFSRDSSGDYTDGDSLVARGVVIEGCTFTNTNWTTTGDNSGTIRMDSHRDWTIRNNSIDAATLSGGGLDANSNGAIYSYAGFDALVEYNEINTGYSGIYWKDTADNNPAYPTVQSTIRYNKFTDFTKGIYLNAGNAGTENDGYHVVYGNIFDDVDSAYGTTGDKQAARISFKHNFVDYRSRTAASFDISSSSNATGDKIIELEGNIFSDTNSGTNLTLNDTGGKTDLQHSDYNLFVSGPDVSIAYGSRITSLATWQAYSGTSVSDADPDANSLANQTLSTLATDATNDDYTLPASSPAEGFMSDSTNAGPYRYGSEVIGVVS